MRFIRNEQKWYHGYSARLLCGVEGGRLSIRKRRDTIEPEKRFNVTAVLFVGLLLGILFGLFMHAPRMAIYALESCSPIVGIHCIGSVSATGRVGGHAVLYFTGTTLFASLLGLSTGITIELVESNAVATRFTSLMDTIKHLIPSPPLQTAICFRCWCLPSSQGSFM